MGAQGHTTIDFGAAPGGTTQSAIVSITGQAGIVAGSDVEAWIRCEDSSDHSKDEHFIENIRVRAGNIASGTGFDLWGEVVFGSAYGVWNVSWVWN